VAAKTSNRKKNEFDAVDIAHFNREINRPLREYSKFKGAKHIKSHSFRTTVITDLYQNEKDLNRVRNIIGHASILSTKRYLKGKLTNEER
jgi:integrase